DVVETLEASAFDIAVSFHVIEHVDSPRSFLRATAQRVRPGGLVVIETPDIGAFPFRLLQSRWREFIPEHYYFFDRMTVRRLMESEGLKVERILNVGKYVSVDLLLNRLTRYSRFVEPVGTLARWTGLSRVTFKVNPR